MKNLTSEEIRKLWIEFWESPERNHKFLSPASLIPDSQDKTVLFTTAGMQQLVPYLVGKKHPQGSRLYNIQKCVRTEDIEEVGDERHLTFFEMMGNWSLGDYFKEESLKFSKEFLVSYLNVSLENVGVTIFQGDDSIGIGEDSDARGILHNIGIPDERIKALDMDENFWGPAGEIGPCGPCAEFHIDRGDQFGPNDWDMGENDRFNEVWNNVFMEYYKNEDGTFSKLKQQNVDTGMGLERICMILQGQDTVFETDLFQGIIKAIENTVNKNYPAFHKAEGDLNNEEQEITRYFRVIADHIRTSVFLVGDGVVPSNEFRGYVLRRLIRRMYYNLIMLNSQELIQLFEEHIESFIKEQVEHISEKYGGYRKEIPVQKDYIVSTLKKEIVQFKKTISHGLKILNEVLENEKNTKNIKGEDAFKLYDTYGFPFELTKEIADNKGFSVDEDGFYNELEKAKERSRSGTQDVFKRGIDWAKYLEEIPQTEFIGYDYTESENSKLLKELDIEGQKVLIFDKTPFYAESGGQTADTGDIVLDDGRQFFVRDVQDYAGVFLHFVK